MKQTIDELKNFRVSKECHSLVKTYCKTNMLKVNEFVSHLLIKTILKSIYHLQQLALPIK